MTIQQLIQGEVDLLVKEDYKDDECPPVYIVSIFENKLLLTCQHMGSAFSEVIFPQEDMTYGLGLLKDEINNLYNRTM